MKFIPTTATAIIFLICVLAFPFEGNARHKCTGSSSCSACTNCNGCAHCNEGGGTCGVCSSGYDDAETYTPPIRTRDDISSSQSSDDVGTESSVIENSYDSNDYQQPEPANKGWGWGWWVAGGFLLLIVIGSSGKK